MEEQLTAAQEQGTAQKQATERLIQQLTVERDESRAQLSHLSEVASRIRVREEEFVAAQEQFSAQKERSASAIRQLEVELVALEARAEKLEEELASAREQLQEQMSIRTVTACAMHDAVQEIYLGSRKLLEINRSFDPKASSQDSAGETTAPPSVPTV